MGYGVAVQCGAGHGAEHDVVTHGVAEYDDAE